MSGIPAPACVLLDEGVELPTDAEESRFFTALNQSNGTTRMTSNKRLDDLNRAIASLLPDDAEVSLLDVGISSGVSSVEWLDSIRDHGRAAKLTGVDHIVFARLFRIGPFQLLAERGGYVLLVHGGWRSFSHPVSRTGTAKNWLAHAAFAVSGWLAQIGCLLRAGTEVELVSRQLRSRTDVQILERDVFSPCPEWNGKFHAVRVANVLNLSYFDEDRLKSGLENAARWVQEGGVLAICRTELDGRNHATIFRRTGDVLRAEFRIGKGSEVEHHVPARLT